MKLNLKNIQWFIHLVEESKIAELEIWEGRRKIRVIKNGSKSEMMTRVMMVPQEKPAESMPVNKEVKTITSPSVGIFHLHLKAGGKSLAEIGQEVKAGQTIGFIDAHGELETVFSDCGGIIKEILLKEKRFTEYGQPLFRIEVSS